MEIGDLDPLDQQNPEWFILLVPTHLGGSPGQRVVKRFKCRYDYLRVVDAAGVRFSPSVQDPIYLLLRRIVCIA